MLWLWCLCLLGILLSFGGIAWGVLRGKPELGQRGGELAIALTLLLAFLGRGTEVRSLERRYLRPGRKTFAALADHLRSHLATEGEGAERTLKDLDGAANALVEVEEAAEAAAIAGDREEAVRLLAASRRALDEIDAPNSTLPLDLLWRVRFLDNKTNRHQSAIASHFDWLRKSAWPLALLSLVAGLASGFGDLAVLMLTR